MLSLQLYPDIENICMSNITFRFRYNKYNGFWKLKSSSEAEKDFGECGKLNFQYRYDSFHWLFSFGAS